MISVPMIVKNEERNLSRALTSLKDHSAITEIVVFDTGSDDRTVQIAKDHGCRVIEGEAVFYMAAEETPDGLPRIDFAACRNKCASYCTGDWLFTMDGDEEVEGDVGALCEYAIERGNNAGAIWVNVQREGYTLERFVQPRMIKNDGSVKWTYPIHNQREGLIEPVGVTDVAEIMSDYGGEGRLEAKHARTKPMLLKLHAEHPEDPHPLWFLMEMAMARQEMAEALQWAALAAEAMAPEDTRWPKAVMNQHMLHYQQGNVEEGKGALDLLLHHHPHYPDARYAELVAAFLRWRATLDKGASYFGLGQGCVSFVPHVSHMASLLGVAR